MNINKQSQKLTHNFKIVFTFLALQCISLPLMAIEISINDSGYLPLKSRQGGTDDIYYLYDINPNAIDFVFDAPIVCTSVNDSSAMVVLEVDDKNTKFLTESMTGHNGITSFIYDFTNRQITIQTDNSLQCASQNNASDSGINADIIFSDGFEDFTPIQNDIDIALVASNNVIAGGDTLHYQYVVTNNSSSLQTFDLVEYFKDNNTDNTDLPYLSDFTSAVDWSCAPDAGSTCGTGLVVTPAVTVGEGLVRIQGLTIAPGEVVTVDVDRAVIVPASVPVNATIDLLAAVFSTVNIDTKFDNNVIFREFATTPDSTAPVVSEISPVDSPTNNTTPSYIFTSNEIGTLNLAACPAIISTTSVIVGNNTVTFDTLAEGVITNCKITVTDNFSNISNELTVGDFTVDLTAPVDLPVFTPAFSTGATATTISNNTTIVGSCGLGANNGEISYRSSTGVELNPDPTITTLSGQNFSTQLIWNSGGQKNFLAKCVDTAGNSGPEFSVNVFVDLTGATVILERSAGQNSTTYIDSAQFTVTFDEEINPSTFISSDITIAGTTGTITSGPTRPNVNDDSIWEFTVTGMTSGDSVTADLLQNTVEDYYGNSNTANTSVNNTVEYLPLTVEFSSSTYTSVNEGAAISGNVIIAGGVINSSLSLNVSLADGATGDPADGAADYAIVPITITVNAADYSTPVLIPFSITLVDDNLVEVNETIDLSLTALTAGLIIGDSNSDLTTQSSAIATITDTDVAAVTFDTVTANEDDGNMTFTFTLDNGVVGGFTFDVNTTDGSATLANLDYTQISNQQVAFVGNAGETQQMTFSPTTDAIVESNENVFLSMSSSSNVDVNISDTALANIDNDD